MLTPQERLNLHNLAKNIPLDPNDCILEFGVFFGGSLEALGKGLAQNPTFSDNVIHGIDVFSCSKPGVFYDIVMERARLIGATNSLEITDRTIDWFNFVKHSLQNIDNIELHQIDARNFQHTNDKVALIHLDLPKYYDEMHTIFHLTLSSFKPDTFIIFQDFFYQWSAEIIAFIFYLIKNDKVTFQYAQDPTLAVQNNNLQLSDLNAFKEKLSDYHFIRTLLLEAIEFLNDKITNSQRESLYMALFQYATKADDVDTIQLIMDLINYPDLSPNVMRIFNELQKNNFDLKSRYNENFIDLPYESKEATTITQSVKMEKPKETKLNLTQTQYDNFRDFEQEFRQKIEDTIPKVHLEDKHIRYCQMLVNREILLSRLPKNAIVAEIGVDHGSFSSEILRLTQPKKLHLIDIWGTDRYHDGLYTGVVDKFNSEIATEQVIVNRALSLEAVSQFEDHYFDWIYIDTDHSYETTKNELDLYRHKMKRGGIIAGHDYAKGNMVNVYRYGVIEAVHEFCIKYDWELIYLTVDYAEQPSFAVRKIS